MSKDWDYHLKITIIGDSGSGKSYITNRYLNNDDTERSDLQTVNFGKKYIQIGNKVIYIKNIWYIWKCNAYIRCNFI